MDQRRLDGGPVPSATCPSESALPIRLLPDFGPGRVGAIDQSTSFIVLRLASVLPAALYRSVAGEPAIAVGQPANHTCRPSSALIGTARHSDPSL
jgi:hypothetical protein